MRPWHLAAPILALLLARAPSQADAIYFTKAATAPTIAEFFITETGVRAELEIGLAELPAFADLLPDALRERMELPAEPAAQRIARFFEQGLPVRADDGAPLPGRLVSLEPRQRLPRDQLTGQPAAGAAEEEGEPVVFAVLEYPFASRPDSLRLGGPLAARGAGVGFAVYHRGLPVIDFRYLAREGVLDLDWQDPWYSRFRSRNLRRQYDAPINLFLYVEPYEVRSEVILRPLDVQQWMDLGIDGRRTIPVELQEEIRRRVGEFVAEHAVVEIDGKRVEGAYGRVHFLRRTLRSSSVIDPPEELDAVSATLGVISVYPTSGLPQEATLTWDVFSDRIQRIPAAATDEAGPLPMFLDPEDRVLRWQNFLKQPTVPTLLAVSMPPRLSPAALQTAGWVAVALLVAVVARLLLDRRRGRHPPLAVRLAALGLIVLCAGAFASARRLSIDAERAEEIVGALLHNVYRAFDFRDESTVYDVLARSVQGDLLARIYLETRRGLEIASQGGARAKVKEVSIEEVTPRPLSGRSFRAHATWTVAGSVGHWGHIHTRRNRYVADLVVRPVDGVWRITDLDILEDDRLP